MQACDEDCQFQLQQIRPRVQNGIVYVASMAVGGFKQLENDLAPGSVKQLEATFRWQLQLAQEQSYLMT